MIVRCWNCKRVLVRPMAAPVDPKVGTTASTRLACVCGAVYEAKVEMKEAPKR